MASFFAKAKNAAIKTKLSGEIALLNGDIKARQKKFGVQVYGLLGEESTFATAEANMFLYSCRDDIQKLTNQRIEKKQTQADMVAQREVAAPTVTTSEKFAKVGSQMSSAGAGARLTMEKKLLDSKMNGRKNTFGIEVLDILMASSSPESKEIQSCIDAAKKDVEHIRSTKERKQNEIAQLGITSK